jgi:hypothetical protein
MIRVKDTQSFIEKANIIHNFKYDYSKSVFISSQSKLTITCPVHGDFQQTPGSHTNMKCGCRFCSLEKNNIFCNTEKFIEKAVIKHGKNYDYSLVQYINNAKKVKIICNKCNTMFLQTPNRHLSTSGCWNCSHVTVFSKTDWINMCNSKNCSPSVYIIRCFNETENFIKIGITSYPIYRRFSSKTSMPYSYEVLKEIKGSSDFLYDKEHLLLKNFKEYQYFPNLQFPGSRECFNISILQKVLKHS